MNKVVRQLRRSLQKFQNFDRDPRYLVMLLWAVPLFILTYVQALNSGWFDSVEKPIFHWVNNWPSFIGGPMYIITQLGSLGGLLLWIGLAWYLINKRAAITVALGGTLGWTLAKVVKTNVHRGRPGEFFHQINVFQQHIYSGFGFPSGHSTFSAACATVLYFQVKPAYRKYVVLAVFLVGISRMYLGAHFPLDVVGGWALGVICGTAAMLLMGSSTKRISAHTLKRALVRKGYVAKSVRMVSLDARGSQPVFIEMEDGTKVFGKVFGAREHAADWLFKLYRFFRYKNLQAEEPYLNGRRNIELESFANLWAKKAGARTADIVDVIKVGRHWLLMQNQLDAKPLADATRVKTATLEDAWKQVMKLHNGNLAHRDLRAANLMVDKSGQVWIIDYGFAEVSPSNKRKYMDIAELLMSMSLVVGVKRTVDAAVKVVGVERLKSVLPYLHPSVFSGATNQALRRNKAIKRELQTELKERLRVKGEVDAPNIERINARKVLTMAAFAVFAYIVIPKLTEFKESFSTLHNLAGAWLLPLFVFSVTTYVAAAAVYVALANLPLKLREATLVQLAASFMSKIVPGGIGATGLNMRYLTKAGMDHTEAAALIVGQNVIGFVTFTVPLLLILLVSGQSFSSIFKLHVSSAVVITGISAGLLVAAAVSFSHKIRRKLQSFVTKFISQLRDLSTSPRELLLASLASLAISLAYVGCLFAAIHAVRADISLLTVVVIYASAMIAKSAIPTPGGLGPVEVAMSAALIGAGLPAGQAFAAVILYRLATFWVPVPFSVLAYRSIVANKII